MPKLIIKQEAGETARRNKIAKWLSLGGLFALLATVAAAAVFFTKSPLPSPELEPLAFTSATDKVAKSGYESLHAILGDLMTEYESLAARGVDGYQKNLMLLGKAESILNHLDKMAGAAQKLGLNDREHEELTDRHQFYKDFWQAKLHFRELRASRFEDTDSPDTQQVVDSQAGDVEQVLPELSGEESQAVVADEQPKKRKFQFAKPPADMELPAGFCDLNNPASCKPDDGASTAEATALVDESMTNGDEALEKPKQRKFQFAKPPADMELPAGFCDLNNPANCKPEDGAGTAATAALDESVTDSDETQEKPKKRKFQFAKPPAGMELPAGFCDLNNPAICKPDDGAGTAANAALDESVTDDETQEKPKQRKFQFAKPPAGMDLPAGFCDLNNPASCKPEDGAGTAETAALDEFVTDGDETLEKPKQRKFQFAKPPADMELPAGFCDLNNPASCKPDDGAGTAANAALDESVTDDETQEKPKQRKFQFAKPPAGMELPAGFCDLNNPASCKPEGDLLSDADQPALNSVAEPKSEESKNKL